MKSIPLHPPFDRDELAQAASLSREHLSVDESDNVRWLLRHQSEGEITRAIKSAWWEASSLPLREWASRIDAVEVFTLEEFGGLGLSVHLIGRESLDITQDAPFDMQVLNEYVKTFPGPIPEILRELAMSAPGLYIDGVGPLAAPTHFRQRLSRITEWVEKIGITRERCAQRGCIYPDPDLFLMEVAENGQGCRYVLGIDGSVCYHEFPELPSLVRCSISLEELVKAFFEAPEQILDPFDNGWAERPPRRRRRASEGDA